MKKYNERFVNGNQRLQHCSYVSMNGVRTHSTHRKQVCEVSNTYLKLVGIVMVMIGIVEYYLHLF